MQKGKIKGTKIQRTHLKQKEIANEKTLLGLKKDSNDKLKSMKSVPSGLTVNDIQRKPCRKNKYKDLANKEKNVGKDSKVIKPVVDVPRRIKFAGSCKQSGIAEWQHEKESLNISRKIGKSKKRKLKSLVPDREITFKINNAQNIDPQEVTEVVGNSQKISKNAKKRKLKNSEKVEKHIEPDHDVGKKVKQSEAMVVSEMINNSIETSKKGKKRKLKDSEEGDEVQDELKKTKQSKIVTKKTVKADTKAMAAKAPKKKNKIPSKKSEGHEISLITLNQRTICNSSSKVDDILSTKSKIPPSNQSPFDISKLKSLLSQSDAVKKVEKDGPKTVKKEKEKQQPQTLKNKLEATLNAAQFRCVKCLI